MTRKPLSHVRILICQAWSITQDSSRERALIFLWQVRPKEGKTTAKDLTKLLDKNLGEITAGGNLNLKLSFVSSFAQALNEQDTEEESDENIEANKKVITFFFYDLLLPGGGGVEVSLRKSVVQSACQYDVMSRLSDFQNGEQSVYRRDG